MTSAEKLAHLSALARTMVVRREGPPILGKLVTMWGLLPGRMKRSLLGDLVDGLADPSDPNALDELLELVAGVAIELRSDERPDPTLDELRAIGRELLGKVIPATA